MNPHKCVLAYICMQRHLPAHTKRRTLIEQEEGGASSGNNVGELDRDASMKVQVRVECVSYCYCLNSTTGGKRSTPDQDPIPGTNFTHSSFTLLRFPLARPIETLVASMQCQPAGAPHEMRKTVQYDITRGRGAKSASGLQQGRYGMHAYAPPFRSMPSASRMHEGALEASRSPPLLSTLHHQPLIAPRLHGAAPQTHRSDTHQKLS